MPTLCLVTSTPSHVNAPKFRNKPVVSPDGWRLRHSSNGEIVALQIIPPAGPELTLVRQNIGGGDAKQRLRQTFHLPMNGYLNPNRTNNRKRITTGWQAARLTYRVGLEETQQPDTPAQRLASWERVQFACFNIEPTDIPKWIGLAGRVPMGWVQRQAYAFRTGGFPDAETALPWLDVCAHSNTALVWEFASAGWTPDQFRLLARYRGEQPNRTWATFPPEVAVAAGAARLSLEEVQQMQREGRFDLDTLAMLAALRGERVTLDLTRA